MKNIIKTYTSMQNNIENIKIDAKDHKKRIHQYKTS